MVEHSQGKNYIQLYGLIFCKLELHQLVLEINEIYHSAIQNFKTKIGI